MMISFDMSWIRSMSSIEYANAPGREAIDIFRSVFEKSRTPSTPDRHLLVYIKSR